MNVLSPSICRTLAALCLFYVALHSAVSGQTLASFALPGYAGLPVDFGGSWVVVALDVDLDNDLDFFVGRTATMLSQGQLHDQILLNDGSGHFVEETVPWPDDGSGTFSALVRDFDGDGIEDLLLGRGPHFATLQLDGGPHLETGEDQLLIHNADGSFSDRSFLLPARVSSKFTMGVAAGNFDGDPYPDLVLVNGGVNYLNRIDVLNPLRDIWNLSALLGDFSLLENLFRNDLYLASSSGNDFEDASLASGLSAIGDLSTDVVAADFDGDGLDDIFVTNFYDLSFALTYGGASRYLDKLYLNDSDNPGTFSWVADRFPADLRPSTAVDAGDIDGDGDLDLLVTQEARAAGSAPGERTRLYLNQGPACFQTLDHRPCFIDVTDEQLPPQPAGSGLPSAYDGHLVDLDGDGWKDILLAGQINRVFRNLRGDDPACSSPCFEEASPGLPVKPGFGLPPILSSYSVAAVDFDGTLGPDLITANWWEQNRLFLQRQDGGFTDTTESNLPADGENTTDVAIADIDRDGLLDIFSVDFDRYSWSLYLQRAGATTVLGATPESVPSFIDRTDLLPDVDDRNTSVDLGDTDGDGRSDLVLVAGYDGIKLLATTGASPPGVPLPLEDVAATVNLASTAHINRARFVDLNNDGHLDVMLANGGLVATSLIGEPNQFFLWQPDTERYADVSDWLPSEALISNDLDFYDINGDGWLDVLVTNHGVNLSSSLYLSSRPFPALDPGYVKVDPAPFGASYSWQAQFVNVNGDSLMDVIVMTGGGGPLGEREDLPDRLFVNVGTATQPAFEALEIGTGDHSAARLADLNEDAYPELIISGFDRNRVLLNCLGPPSARCSGFAGPFRDVTIDYLPLPALERGASSHSLALADVNRDGLLDVYFARDNQDHLFYGVAVGLFQDGFESGDIGAWSSAIN